MPGYAAALAALDDGALERLLAERLDLRAGQPPASFGELASRASTPASLTAALARLDAGTLQVAELLAVIGLPATLAAVRAAAGPALRPAVLTERLDRLAALGLAMPVADGRIVGPRSLGVPFGRPGGLGKPVAELARIGLSADQLKRVAANLGLDVPSERKADLVRAVAAGLGDVRVVAGVVAAAGDDERALLARARAAGGEVTVPGSGSGRYADFPDARPATWLLDHGLLLPATYTRLVVARETELALRGGWVFPRWPDPPSLPSPAVLPAAHDHATAAAYRFVVAAETCLIRLDRAPLPLIKVGTVSARDQRALARALELSEAETAFMLDLLVAAGLLVVGGAWDRRSLGLAPAADDWLAASRAQRWARLAVAWRDHATAFEEHLLASHGLLPPGDEAVRPLLVRQVTGVMERRRGVLTAIADVPGNSVVPAAAVTAMLHWRQPQLWRGELHRVVLSAAALLGLAVVAPATVALATVAPATVAPESAVAREGVPDRAAHASGGALAYGGEPSSADTPAAGGSPAAGAAMAGAADSPTGSWRDGAGVAGALAGDLRGDLRLDPAGVDRHAARDTGAGTVGARIDDARHVAQDAGAGAANEAGTGSAAVAIGTPPAGHGGEGIHAGADGGGAVGPGLASCAWIAGADEAGLAYEAAGALTDGGREFLVAGDLTVVAPGGLAPDVDARLGVMAERASIGGAATWRVDAASVRRALDAGETADSILEFMRAHSRTTLPQALEYLVGDVGRRHGRLRVGGAATYLRGDPAAIAELVRSGPGRRLGLREVGDGVAVTARSQQDVLAALRAAGEAPVAEEPDGTPRVEARKPVRHAARSTPAPYTWPATPVPTTTSRELIARLRAVSPQPAHAQDLDVDGDDAVYARGEVAAVCERAARQRRMVVIAYRDGEAGGEVARLIAPLRVRAGAVVARTGMSHTERVYALDRITWARPAAAGVHRG